MFRSENTTINQTAHFTCYSGLFLEVSQCVMACLFVYSYIGLNTHTVIISVICNYMSETCLIVISFIKFIPYTYMIRYIVHISH